MPIKKTLCFSLGTLLLASALIVPSALANQNSLYVDDLVRIPITNGLPTLPRGVEIAGGVTGQAVDIIIPAYREGELTALGLTYSILVHDIDAYSAGYRGQYHSLAQMETFLQTTASAYSNICQLTSLGKTYLNRDIWCLEISDHPGVEEGELAVAFIGVHHAREWPGMEITLNLINLLTSGYASNTTIQNLVNNRRIFIVPCMNADGYYHSHDQSVDWRKNMHYFPQYSSTGVDLNRNYAGSCNGVGLGEWGTVYQDAASHHAPEEVYCGPGPNSELEVQAIESLFTAHNICAAISWHTYEELVLWPYGYANTQTPDNTYLVQVGQQIAARIHKQSGGGTYTPQQSVGLYPTTGDMLDWLYGYSYYELGHSCFCYTIEACSSFQPSQSYLDQICAENARGGFYLLTEAQNISQIAQHPTRPTITPIPVNDTGTYTLHWQVANPTCNPDQYELDELTGLSLTTDGAETGMTNWASSGFTVSTQHAHSGTSSFKGNPANDQTSTLTSATPIPVTPGMTLDYWTYFNTEQYFDYGFAEASIDGRVYDVLGNFTGTGTTWTEHQADLSAYVGKSVFLRFRYVTDSSTAGEGFYVDDITPVATFAQNTTLSNTLTAPQYTCHDRPNGTYYYRARAHTAARGWGDFSTIQTVTVAITHHGNDTTPPTVNITSPTSRYLYLFNHPICPFFTTLIIGKITVSAAATDDVGIAQVDFYVDDVLMYTDITQPYSWDWTNHTTGKHTLKVVATDTSDNTAEQDLTVRKFL